MSLIKLFILFTKIGAILLGGGYVILPILKSEFVDKYKLISEEELIDYFAISQSLPGIIAVNISIFVGYKLYKIAGAIFAVLGMMFAPFWTIVLLASLIAKFVTSTPMQGIFWGVGIGVIVLLISATREIWNKAIVDKFSLSLFLLMVILLVYLNLSPIIVIVSSAILGILYKSLIRKLEGF